MLQPGRPDGRRPSQYRIAEVPADGLRQCVPTNSYLVSRRSRRRLKRERLTSTVTGTRKRRRPTGATEAATPNRPRDERDNQLPVHRSECPDALGFTYYSSLDGKPANRSDCGMSAFLLTVYGSMPILSFTAPRRRCLHPRYVSVVCTETWPSRNWICSISPPAAWHRRAQERRLCRSRHNRSYAA